jgi:hypothetical protein
MLSTDKGTDDIRIRNWVKMTVRLPLLVDSKHEYYKRGGWQPLLTRVFDRSIVQVPIELHPTCHSSCHLNSAPECSCLVPSWHLVWPSTADLEIEEHQQWLWW